MKVYFQSKPPSLRFWLVASSKSKRALYVEIRPGHPIYTCDCTLSDNMAFHTQNGDVTLVPRLRLLLLTGMDLALPT